MSNNPATIDQVFSLIGRIKAKKPTREQIEQLFSSGLLSDILDADLTKIDREIVRKALGLDPILTGDIFQLTIPSGITFEQRVQMGKYDTLHRIITEERFPISDDQIGKFEGRYFHFNRKISSKDVVKEIESTDINNPWQVAKIGHLLSFADKFPDEQRKYPIVGLGSYTNIEHHLSNPLRIKHCSGFPLLHGTKSHRGVYLHSSYSWAAYNRFLAVRSLF